MTYIVFLCVILLIAVFATYTVVENNRKKAEAFKKQQFNDRVKYVTENYKKQISLYAEAKLIRPKHVPMMQAVVNNFFVVQPHSESNLILMEVCLENLTNVLASEMAKSHVTGNKDQLAERILNFVSELPTGRDFNKIFYEQLLPGLVTSLKSADVLNEATIEALSAEENEAQTEEKSSTTN
ncbi:hypothetical protein [Pseudoalteromonas tunicata]|jgi:hypothetical protein|uniref:Putative orphan protein n=1 Tax=Pseudoalteromonas tunicata D2 TaxID=87626 RepID=A4C5N1_9GAMM|nr:hypothetical protein [Pseudoalteromonas tunicata]ATC95259.1 hypothetical protein PTUN_a2844 [Pseudoalteromonas tunicata]AXT30863.1 hypothetical protein D1819_08710 [Pseudoalteromonas tunicata]EAR29285.1 putative orphan protein [Pseudoalteromonas tunicata D2]MDP4982376.1 hypothetical protein [Pseudoalteromonas tunicata]